jgi:hypothetical protein
MKKQQILNFLSSKELLDELERRKDILFVGNFYEEEHIISALKALGYKTSSRNIKRVRNRFQNWEIDYEFNLRFHHRSPWESFLSGVKDCFNNC